MVLASWVEWIFGVVENLASKPSLMAEEHVNIKLVYRMHL